ncbi:type VI secretion system baseplate subunit TssF [Enterobacteriaceae bacterium 4M9]|nr:type VI secretion system baseplate subunit TssF [Enterobacteriaceae bacterium 4M9]
MDSRLLEYYNRELNYLREMGAEFAASYPKVAGRLGMQGIEVNDPYVERLMEGFAFLTSRIQLKMDAEFPRFSQRMLEMIYPNYLAPTPSMAIVELQPDARKGNINGGFLVPAGTVMNSDALQKRGITCKYRTAHDVMLYPLTISQAALEAPPQDIANVAGIRREACQSALRLRVRLDDQVTPDDISLDKLTFYLSGPDIEAVQLLELMMQHTVGMLCQPAGQPALRHYLAKNQLRHEGFESSQALLPNDLRNFDGYRLLQEYFAFPARFRFFSVSGLAPLFTACREQGAAAREFEIILLLDKSMPTLAKRVDASYFSLHCTPVINLFSRVADRITLNNQTSEYHLVVDNIQPLDYEVFSVQRLWGTPENYQHEQEFRPFYSTQGRDGQNYGAYFSQRRAPRPLSSKSLRHGTRSSYSGSEVFLSLVDAQHAPWRQELEYITADVLVTNRDLPLLLQNLEMLSFSMSDSIPIEKITLRKPPSSPRAALAEGRISWGLISQLQLDYLSLMEGDEAQSATTLRELLTLYARLDEPQIHKEINGVKHCRLTPTYQRSPVPGPVVFARGIAVDLTIDEQAFSGGTPYLLGCVLEQLFSRIVTLNAFVTTSLSTPQRGNIARWPARVGRRTLL